MNRHERRRAQKTDRQDATAQVGLGFAKFQRGDLAGAEAVFRCVLNEQPDHPEAMRLLGDVLIDRDQPEAAVALLSRLVTLQPGRFDAHYALGNAHRLSGGHEAAIAAYRASISLNPGFAGALHGLGLALRGAQREAEALEPLRLAARAKPGWAVAWKDLGLTLAILGDLGMAEAALRRAVALQPGLGDAQRHLAALRGDPPGEAEMARLAACCADPRTPVDERIELRFALGRLADKAGDFSTAFGHFSAANALLREAQHKAGIGFDRTRLSRDVDELIRAFPASMFSGFAGWGDASDAPVFILGMPRAGSTLFEQIAASHSLVFGAGERMEIGALARKLGWAPSPVWTEESIADAAGHYLEALRGHAGVAARIVDKMPDNVFQLGLIAALFPNARIIFCVRDARDIALSCFFQHFAQPYGFDTDLDDCAFRVGEVERLCAHWRDVLPLAHMTMSYEDLLADPEGESRRLVAFLGLEWEPQCLEFYRHGRAIRTASWAQVRQPLYRASVGKWRSYAAYFPSGSRVHRKQA